MKRKEKEFIKKNFSQVLHTTFNPHGPGVVRIHLAPSSDVTKVPSLVFINGDDIIPINKAWAFILASFINNVNVYQGKEISKDELNIIVNKTLADIKKIYPFIKKQTILNDLWRIINTLCKIAQRQEILEEIGYLTIADYAPYMKAPHRMDLMVSAMTKDGRWHCNQKCLHCYAAGQKCSDEKEVEFHKEPALSQ